MNDATTIRQASSLASRLARRMGMASANDLPPPSSAGDAPESTGPALPPAPANARLLQADDLFLGEREVLIQNGTDIYRLRRTRNGKLILCK